GCCGPAAAAVVRAVACCSAPVAARAVAGCCGPAAAVVERAVAAGVFRPADVAVEHVAVRAWLAPACPVADRDGFAFRPAVPAVHMQEQQSREAKTKWPCW